MVRGRFVPAERRSLWVVSVHTAVQGAGLDRTKEQTARWVKFVDKRRDTTDADHNPDELGCIFFHLHDGWECLPAETLT